MVWRSETNNYMSFRFLYSGVVAVGVCSELDTGKDGCLQR